MSDDDRLLNTIQQQGRTLDDGCANCNMSAVFCRCVTYLDGPYERCCDTCSGH